MKHTTFFNSKKANVIGFAIIALAFLLLIGSMVTMDSDYSSSDSKRSSSTNNRIGNINLNNEILFQINDTIFGEELIKSTNFPNMKIGNAKEYLTLYEQYDVFLQSTPLSSSKVEIPIDNEMTSSDDFIGLLIMPYPKNGLFTEDLEIRLDSTLFKSENKPSALPLVISKSQLFNVSTLTLQLEDLKWYQITKRKSQELQELKVVAISKDSRYSSRTIDFLVNTQEENLKNVQLKLSVICPQGEDGSTPIEGYVNGFKVFSQNPRCASLVAGATVLSAQIPLSILNDIEDEDNKNELLLETFGTYETSLQIEEVSFNDEYTYSFYLNNNKNLHDVIVFADFNLEFLDVQINSYRFSIPRKQTVSIKNKLRSGKNIFTIHETPVEIKEFTIEQVNKEK